MRYERGTRAREGEHVHTDIGAGSTITIIVLSISQKAAMVSVQDRHLVAICISGQVREFTNPAACENIYHSMVEPIANMSDVFFTLDNVNNAKARGAESKLGSEGASVRAYPVPPRCTALFSPVSVSWDHFNTTHNRVGCDPMRQGVNTGSGQAYSNHRCYRQIEDFEKASGRYYNWVLRLRPDVMYRKRLPDQRWLSAAMDRWQRAGDVIHVPNTGACRTRGRLCFADFWGLMTRGAARAYMGSDHTYAHVSPSCLIAYSAWRKALQHLPNAPYFVSHCPECRISFSVSQHCPGATVCGLRSTYNDPKGLTNWFYLGRDNPQVEPLRGGHHAITFTENVDECSRFGPTGESLNRSTGLRQYPLHVY